MIDLAAIKARLAAAAKPPWVAHRSRVNTAIVAVDVADDGETAVIREYIAERALGEENIDFITHAPADIAALVAELEAACDALRQIDRHVVGACESPFTNFPEPCEECGEMREIAHRALEGRETT